MRTLWKDDLSRRSVLQLGITGAALLAVPWPLQRKAQAQTVAPHFSVLFQADGGWDPTQVFDAHDPNDSTDGIDVDVPGQPASTIATIGGLTYLSNPVTRPTVDLFFSNWAAYRGHRLSLVRRPWFLFRRLAGVGVQALGRVRTALQLRDTDAGDDFTMQVPDAIGADVTLLGLARTCMAENERRLAPFDPRLLRPKIVPTLVGLALKFAPAGRA